MMRLFLLAILSLTAGAAFAADAETPSWYDVEVLVFKNNTPSGLDSEVWPVDPGQPDLTHVTELVPPAQTSPLPGGAQPFQQLDDTALTLRSAASRLAAAPGYRPLLHLAWRQPVTAQADAPAVHVASATGAEAAPALDGLVRVSRNRFLHIDLDLLYRPDGTATAYRLQQSRRINSGEVHYFDHPAFGLLVKLTPYDPAGQKDGRAKPR